MIKIYFTPIKSNIFTEKDENMMKYLSDSRQKSISERKSDANKLNSLYSELLLRHILYKDFNIQVEPNDIVYRSGKKPYILSEPKIDFNFSHTKGGILCGVSDQGTIGVDLEGMRRLKVNLLGKRLHEAEQEYIFSTDDETEQNVRLIEIWTKKEAYTKCTGTGLTVDLREINTLNEAFASKIITNRVNNMIYSVATDIM